MKLQSKNKKNSSNYASTPFFKKENNSSFFNNSSAPFFGGSTIQTKLNIGKPNDAFEQEADNMAEQVVAKHGRIDTSAETRNGSLAKNNFLKTSSASSSFIQSKCATCEHEEEKELQKKSNGESKVTPSHSIENSISSSKGSGRRLPPDTQSQMESSFGVDLSNVTIHSDDRAAQMNKTLNAKAFTTGADIYFNSGNYDTKSNSGKRLLAHELTHVVQQGGGGKDMIQKQPAPVNNPTPVPEKQPAATTQAPPVLFAMDTAVRPPSLYFSVAFPGHKLVTIANYLYGRPEAVDELMAANPGLGYFAQPGQAIKPLKTPLTPAAAALLEQNTKSGSLLRTLGVPVAPQKEIIVYSVTIPGTGDFKVTEQQFIALLNGSILWVGRKAAYYSELIRGFKEIRDEFLEDRNSVVGGISDWLGDVSPPDSKYWNDPMKLADAIVLDLRGLKGLVPLEYFSAEINQDKDLVQDIFRETNIPRLQIRLKENLALLVKVAEGEQIVNKRWHNFIEGTISGASVAVNTLEIVRNVSFGIAAGLAGAIAAPAVFAAAGAGLAGVGVTGTAATVLAGGTAVAGGAGAGALLQGSLNVVAPGMEADKSIGERFKSGAKKGSVSGAIGGAGALVAPGVAGSIGSKLFGAGADVALTGGQQLLVNVLTGVTVGVPAGFVNGAVENLEPWMNGEITLGEFFTRCGYSAAWGGVAGGAFAFIPINGLYRSGGQPFNPFSGEPVLPRFMLAGPWSPLQAKWTAPPEFNALPPSQLPNLPEGYAWARIGGQWEPISLKGPFGEPLSVTTGKDPNGNLFYDLVKIGSKPTISEPWKPGPSIKGGNVSSGSTTGSSGGNAPRAELGGGGGGAQTALKIVPEPLVEPELVPEPQTQPGLKAVPKYVPGQSKVVKPGTNVGPSVGGALAPATGKKKKEEDDENKNIYTWKHVNTPFLTYPTTVPNANYQVQGHHVWPKVLGGPESQTLMNIIYSIHQSEMHYGFSPANSPVVQVLGSIYDYLTVALEVSPTYGPKGKNVLQGRILNHTGTTNSGNDLLKAAMSAGTADARNLTSFVRLKLTEYYEYFNLYSNPHFPRSAYRKGLDESYNAII